MKSNMAIIGGALLALLLWACGGPEPTPPATPTPAPSPTAAPAPPPPTPPSPTPTPTPPLPAGTQPTAVGTPTPGLPLELVGLRRGEPYLSGDELVEATVATTGFAVVGVTAPDAFVTVDGTPVLVDEQGLFVHSIPLLEGPNLASVIASDFQGNERAMFLMVLSVPPTQGLPLHVLWPREGATVDVGSISVIGTTSPDAVVTVQGAVASVNAFGVFRSALVLEEGPNLIEVVASDLLGNSGTIQLTIVWVT